MNSERHILKRTVLWNIYLRSIKLFIRELVYMVKVLRNIKDYLKGGKVSPKQSENCRYSPQCTVLGKVMLFVEYNAYNLCDCLMDLEEVMWV